MRIINEDKQQLPQQSAFSLGQEYPSVKNTTISGLVMSIVDGNSFVMSVQFVDDKRRREKYTEKIKIYGMDKPSVSTLSGILAKLDLEKRIVGRRVECEILGRDESDHVIARIPKRYLLPSFPFPPDVKH
ncbi:MAG: hypothetical protein HQ506_12500 [Candidatus Marinimicrobia bacterium]|nr:hypothetical protein [Candidatus Neomarinimicrobiota bacterium]